MFRLEYIELPYEFAQLFKVNMESVGRHFKSLPAKATLNKSFYNLVKYSFPKQGEEFDISVILKKLGWHGLRDKITSQHLFYIQNNCYSQDVKSKLVNELQDIEENFAPYRVQGYSRVFLLGFYLKVCSLQGKNPAIAQEIIELLKGSEILNLLRDSSSKVVGLDWVILILVNLRELMGSETLLTEIREGKSYKTIFNALEEKAKDQIITNLMNYGLSINDEEMFLKNIS